MNYDTEIVVAKQAENEAHEWACRLATVYLDALDAQNAALAEEVRGPLRRALTAAAAKTDAWLQANKAADAARAATGAVCEPSAAYDATVTP